MKNLSGQVGRFKNVALKQSQRIAGKALEKKDQTTGFLEEVGNLTVFFLRFWKELLTPPFELQETIKQCYLVGNKSLGLVSITGIIMGLVLTIQSRPTLADFGAESWLPGMVAVSIIREIGPVITALICAGKVGSGIGAELGSMKVTEQIEAMEVSGTNPYEYLVVTRILATTLMVPILVIFADTMGLIGSFIGVNIKGDVNIFLFFSQAFGTLEFIDVVPATIKTIMFGFVIGFVGCYKGYNAGRGTESVGKAANAAVVAGSLMVFVVDMIAVQITDMFVK